MVNISPTMNIMRTCMRKAVRGLLRDFNEVEQLQVSEKGPGNFVSIADKRTEETIFNELNKAKPGYHFLMEERGEVAGSNLEYRWIVDPLDGTTNFLHSLPYFCVTFALEKKLANGEREIIAAITEAPILKEIYWAEKGKGAWMEDAQGHVQRLRIAKRKELKDSLTCLGSLRGDAEILVSLKSHVAGIRCLGSTALALAYLAAGKMDVFVQQNVAAWDIAAGILFIKEAGGIVKDLKGQNNMLTEGSIVASNPILMDILLKKLSQQ